LSSPFHIFSPSDISWYFPTPRGGGGYWQTWAKFVIGRQRILVTPWANCEGIGTVEWAKSELYRYQIRTINFYFLIGCSFGSGGNISYVKHKCAVKTPNFNKNWCFLTCLPFLVLFSLIN
jgi:hypothetical protein